MKLIKYLFVSIMILSLSGGLAHGMAQAKQNEDNTDMLMEYQRMDKNNDGRITRKEWQNYFNNQDWNGDGYLSNDEVRPSVSRQSASSDQFS